jgi:uncharacterized protein (DUF58 family)
VYVYLFFKLDRCKNNLKVEKKYSKKTKEEDIENIEYTLKNPSNNKLFNLILYDNFEGHIDRRGDTSFIESLQDLDANDYLKKKKKVKINNGMGKKVIGPTVFLTTDILGLHKLTYELNDIDEIEVYPKVYPTTSPKVRPTVENISFGFYDTKIRGNNVNFYCAKEYREGDNVKQINWKLSLKSNKIIINQFENNTNADITALLIDDNRLHFGSGSINSFEYCKDLLLSLCHAHIKSNNGVALVTHQKTILPKTGKRHLNALELQISKLEPFHFSTGQLFHRKKISLPEIEKLKKRVFALTEYSKQVFIFTGFIPGKVWDLYFETIKELAKMQISIHLIIACGFNTIANDVGQDDKVWLKKLQSDLANDLHALKNNCHRFKIKLSIVSIDEQEDYKSKIRRGFKYEKLS